MEELRVRAGDGQMTCLAGGDNNNPVILYIHGNLGSRIWYRDVMDVPGRRTLAPDMPNFSDSTPTGDFSMAGYARSLEDFLEAVGAGDAADITVVGHSLGGVVAMELVARSRVAVSRLVLVSPGPIDGLVTPKEYYPVIETYKTDRGLLSRALATVVPSLDNPELLDKLTDEAGKMHPGAFLGHPDELAAADYRERMGRLDIPALIVRGEADTLITADMCLRTAGHLGAAYRELPGVGHSPMVEDPELFLSVLKEFLE